MPSPEAQARIAVLGGGIAGLTAAHQLARSGHQVVLLEGSPQWGGLGTWFEWRGRFLDKFYHCQMPSDDDLIGLIGDLGLSDALYWKPTRMGFVVKGRRYAFNGPLDLLRFAPLNLVERFRFGVISLLLRRLGKGKDLDNTRIEDWLVDCYGRSIWEKLLKPLFVSKFGPAAGDMPAFYIWERLGREKNTVSRGYLRGGLKAFLDAMERRLGELGVEMRLNAPVRAIRETDQGMEFETGSGVVRADWVISTLPLPTLRRALGRTRLAERIQIPEVRSQGVVNAMFFLKRPRDNYYWAPVVASGTEFDGIVEMTELVDVKHYGGYHVAYVMKYCDRDSALFGEDPQDIARRWKSQLVSLYPDLGMTEDDVEDVQVFKAPFVEPAYPLGYAGLKPAVHDGESRLFLACSAQVYPRITAWNSSVALAREVVDQLRRTMRVSPGVAEVKEAA